LRGKADIADGTFAEIAAIQLAIQASAVQRQFGVSCTTKSAGCELRSRHYSLGELWQLPTKRLCGKPKPASETADSAERLSQTMRFTIEDLRYKTNLSS
jgi:hypothetical protein